MNTTVENRTPNNRRLQGLVVAAVMLFSVSSAQAALVETKPATWGGLCCDVSYQTTYGNNALGGIAEITTQGAAPVQTAQNTFQSGVAQSFTLAHDSATGDLTFTLGNAQSLVIDLAPGTGWGTIGLSVETKGGAKDNRIVELQNLVLNDWRGAYAFVNSPLAGTTDKSGVKTNAIIFTGDAAEVFNDFTLSGTMRFTWDSGKIPKATDMIFAVGVSDQVTGIPVPAAVWLFGSALGLLGAMRRRTLC